MNDLKGFLIQDFTHDGRGITEINHKKTFVSFALKNEIVDLKIIKKYSNYNDAIAQNIIKPAIERIDPICQHFMQCGGCSLQHMNMQTQMMQKQKTLLDQLKYFGKVIPNQVLPPLLGETQGYRRKARIGIKFVYKKNKLLIGFREKHSSRYLADLEYCKVLHPKLGERFQSLRELINSLSIFKEMPQIEFAMGDTEAALIFRHLQPFQNEDVQKLIAFGQEHNFHIYLEPNPPEKIHRIWPISDTLERIHYFIPEFGIEFSFFPNDFTQINLEINKLMIGKAIELLELNDNDTVLDLFCGIGNFSLPIATKVKQVIGIEGSATMVDRANENARNNKLTNTDFLMDNLMQVSDKKWTHSSYDKVLLDPPRTGAQEIIPTIANTQAKKIVYISCNPATLARDAGLLTSFNYTLEKVGLINMFPHTTHTEAIAVFQKRNVK